MIMCKLKCSTIFDDTKYEMIRLHSNHDESLAQR